MTSCTIPSPKERLARSSEMPGPLRSKSLAAWSVSSKRYDVVWKMGAARGSASASGEWSPWRRIVFEVYGLRHGLSPFTDLRKSPARRKLDGAVHAIASLVTRPQTVTQICASSFLHFSFLRLSRSLLAQKKKKPAAA
jgi:hypothetical protein